MTLVEYPAMNDHVRSVKNNLPRLMAPYNDGKTISATTGAFRGTACIYVGQEEDVYRLYSELVPPLVLLCVMQSVPLYYILSGSLGFMSTRHTACTGRVERWLFIGNM